MPTRHRLAMVGCDFPRRSPHRCRLRSPCRWANAVAHASAYAVADVPAHAPADVPAHAAADVPANRVGRGCRRRTYAGQSEDATS